MTRTIAPCPDCCTGRWSVGGIDYTPLNANATCTATGGLVPGGGCVTGTPADAVLASVTGSIRIACTTPLKGDDGNFFPNPCVSKDISWLSISLEWDFLKASGAISVLETGCSAVVNLEIEDCREFGPAGADKDLLVRFFLTRCSEGCSGGLGT